MFEKPPQPPQQTITELHKQRFQTDEEYNDLRNQEVISRIIIEGTDEEREKLRLFHNISPENFDLICHYERLRHQTKQASETAAEERKKTNPKFTEIEKQIDSSMAQGEGGGVYLEHIEPQVKQAVIDLSDKGYSTFESGFYGENLQKISFDSTQLAGYQPSSQLLAWLKDKKIKLKTEPTSISFLCGTKYTLGELKEIWDRIVADLPEREK